MDPLTLDDLDRQLAHALQVDGRASFSQIAAVLGASDRTVARRYQRLRSTGALRVVGLPYAGALGHVDWLIRMRCTPDAAMPVATALARRADTSWVSVMSGGTEISCITRTRKQAEDGELLLQRLPRNSRVTSVSAHCILRAVAGTNGWPGRTAALTPDQVAALQPPAAQPAGRVTLTTADNDLLTMLARDGRATHPALAAATGWSETTVRRRLEELRRTDILYFDVEIDPALFGYTAEAMLWLTVAPSALTGVTQALASHPQIAYATAVTGPAGIAASVLCRNLDELYEYLANGVGALDGVSSAETVPLVRRVKGAGTVLVS
ncbi:AsnC family transcriptional regulator [Actinoplanes ianthinogenes]|uniref:AsnC family transcriptional regulator n=1 Tax=Actinoplanes ianthinogenes TaxID=122358 RepID=A0ABN6CT56_9ACTN|nr:Lrp/AsnC family transcriptional regulator [Actinoplanes ianthinogenes]BCJ48411.1 AsnC family transcriptional regulator [Actinoplanes ianthinogenes]GGR46577.1 AsnC family transcriptional regulator [Actinoplanes ianthinogenes]